MIDPFKSLFDGTSPATSEVTMSEKTFVSGDKTGLHA